MTWFKVDDKLHAHPKWWALSPNAKALWTTAGSWASSYKTDGLIATGQLPILAAVDGWLYQHEDGLDADGTVLAAYLKRAPLRFMEGRRITSQQHARTSAVLRWAVCGRCALRLR